MKTLLEKHHVYTQLCTHCFFHYLRQFMVTAGVYLPYQPPDTSIRSASKDISGRTSIHFIINGPFFFLSFPHLY